MVDWVNTRDARYSGSIRLILAGTIYAKLFGEVSREIDAFLRADKPKVFVALTSSVRDYLSSVYDCLKRQAGYDGPGKVARALRDISRA